MPALQEQRLVAVMSEVTIFILCRRHARVPRESRNGSHYPLFQRDGLLVMFVKLRDGEHYEILFTWPYELSLESGFCGGLASFERAHRTGAFEMSRIGTGVWIGMRPMARQRESKIGPAGSRD